MKLLSRKEEIILLAVWKLQEDAYGVTIREYIEKMTGQKLGSEEAGRVGGWKEKKVGR